jgi:hypothetical protein
MYMMVEAAIDRSKLFGQPPLTPDEVRLRHRALEEAEKIEQERAKRGERVARGGLNKEGLRSMIEERLRREAHDSSENGS